MLIPSFLFQQEVQIQTATNGAYQQEFWEARAAKCRLEPCKKFSSDKEGNSVYGNMKAYFPPTVEIKAGDRVTYQDTQYQVIEISPRYGLKEIVYIEVLLR